MKDSFFVEGLKKGLVDGAKMAREGWVERPTYFYRTRATSAKDFYVCGNCKSEVPNHKTVCPECGRDVG